MNSSKLYDLINRCDVLRPIFIGVFARNNIPTKELSKRKSWAMIINLDKFSQPGTHWVAVFAPKNKKYLEYFDSTGRMASHYSIKKLLRQREYYIYNNIPLQSKYTTTCGQYCLFFLCGRAHGLQPHEIISFFKHDNRIFNDRFVNRAVQSIFNTKLKLVNIDFIKSLIERNY